MAFIEAVPNLSEGRKPRVVEALADAFTASDGAWLLDIHQDPSHHRCVLTAALTPDALVASSCALAARAIEDIDLRHHRGVHPRIGALDVLPFVALDGVSRADTKELAYDVAGEIARRFELPVFLYGDASEKTRPLNVLRRGGLEMLQQRMDDGELAPDFGPNRVHPTAGATAVAVRDVLIAYNVALQTDDVRIASAIARTIRASSGGLDAVQALGMKLPHRSVVQVSTNLTDFRATSMLDVYEAVEKQADARGVAIDHSELVGLIPAEAAFDDMVARLKLLAEPGILEERLRRAVSIDPGATDERAT